MTEDCTIQSDTSRYGDDIVVSRGFVAVVPGSRYVDLVKRSEGKRVHVPLRSDLAMAISGLLEDAAADVIRNNIEGSYGGPMDRSVDMGDDDRGSP